MLYFYIPKMKEDEKNFSKRVAILSQNKNYENPKITPEGYGSFITPAESPNDPLSKAKEFKSKADTLNNKESITLYLNSLFYYFKEQQRTEKEDIKTYLSMLKFVIKLTEHTIAHSKKFEEHKTASALEWALFNLKLIKLMKEADILSKIPDMQFYMYIIDTLKSMEVYRNSNKTECIELVEIEDLEDGIKKRLD